MRKEHLHKSISTSSKLNDEFNVFLSERCDVSETWYAWYAFLDNSTSDTVLSVTRLPQFTL